MVEVSTDVAHRLVETSAGPVRYREVGHGTTLLFLHGAFVDGEVWRPVVERLSDRYRCVVPDWPLGAHRLPLRATADLSLVGVGRIVDEVLAGLDLDDVTLVANDSGGAIAQAVMAGGAPRLGRVVLTTCEVEGLPLLARTLIAPAYVPGGLWAVAQAVGFAPVGRVLAGTVARRPVPAAVADALHRPLRADRRVRRDLGRFLRAMRRRGLRAAAGALGRFDRPVLVVWGSTDRVLPVGLAHRLVELLPDARLELLDDCRTFLMLDRPDALASLIAGFVPIPSRLPAGAER